MLSGDLPETAVLRFSLFLLLNCCESALITCPTIFWFPLASNWTVGFAVIEPDELWMSLIKLAIPTKSGRTLTDEILNSVIPFNVSRILTIKWSCDVRSSPAGNRTWNWNAGAGEKATIVCCDGSFVQANQTKKQLIFWFAENINIP